MAIERSKKSKAAHKAREWVSGSKDDIIDVQVALKEYIDAGGNPETAEYQLAERCIQKITVLLDVAQDNIRELAREAHLEDLARAAEE